MFPKPKRNHPLYGCTDPAGCFSGRASLVPPSCSPTTCGPQATARRLKSVSRQNWRRLHENRVSHLGTSPSRQFVRQFPLSGLFLFSVFLGNYYPTWLSHSLTSRTGRERETRLFLWKLNCYAIYDFSCVQRTLSCLLCLVMLYSFLTDRINVLEVKEDKDGTIYLQTLQ